MALEDRLEIVSVVEETYALMGRMLSTDVPGALLPGIRPEIMARIRIAEVDLVITDQEMLFLLRTAYLDLLETVLRLRSELLAPYGGNYDGPLQQAQLTGSGRIMKVRGWRRSLGRVLEGPPAERPRWVKKALEWANVILGSLRGVPVAGLLADPIKELKESVEAQADDDQGTAQ